MKICPYCAEEIQDAAKVCKHCRRSLAKHSPLKTVAVVLGAIFLLLVAVYFVGDSEEFAAFKAERTAWHEKCDAYVDVPLTDPNAAECKKELDALMEKARAHGWAK